MPVSQGGTLYAASATKRPAVIARIIDACASSPDLSGTRTMITRTVAIPSASLIIKRPIWPSRQRPSPEHDVAGGPKISDADLRNMLSQNFYGFS